MSQRHYGGPLVAPATAASLRSLLITAGFITADDIPVPGPAYRTLLIRLAPGSNGPVYFGRHNGVNPFNGAATTNLTNAGVGATGALDDDLRGAGWDLHDGQAFTDYFFIAGNGSDTILVDIHE